LISCTGEAEASSGRKSQLLSRDRTRFSVKVLSKCPKEERAAAGGAMRKDMTEEEREEHGRKIREGIARSKERRRAEGRDSVRYNQRM
jgi:hypothetical protein